MMPLTAHLLRNRPDRFPRLRLSQRASKKRTILVPVPATSGGQARYKLWGVHQMMPLTLDDKTGMGNCAKSFPLTP